MEGSGGGGGGAEGHPRARRGQIGRGKAHRGPLPLHPSPYPPYPSTLLPPHPSTRHEQFFANSNSHHPLMFLTGWPTPPSPTTGCIPKRVLKAGLPINRARRVEFRLVDVGLIVERRVEGKKFPARHVYLFCGIVRRTLLVVTLAQIAPKKWGWCTWMARIM